MEESMDWEQSPVADDKLVEDVRMYTEEQLEELNANLEVS